MVIYFGWGKLFTIPIWIFLIFYIVLEENFLMYKKIKLRYDDGEELFVVENN